MKSPWSTVEPRPCYVRKVYSGGRASGKTSFLGKSITESMQEALKEVQQDMAKHSSLSEKHFIVTLETS